MKTSSIYTLSLLILVLSACSKDKIPGVYRVDIQQGNEVTQEMINQLKPGMTKNQVAYIMGTPLIMDTFHPDRWDYLYSFHPGNGDREQSRITIYFSGDTLSYLDGNMRLVERAELPQIEKVDSNVVVPLSDKKVGLIEDIKETIGIAEDSETNVKEQVDLFKDRPIPQPTQSKGLLGRISGSVSADETQEDITAPVDPETSEKPSLLKRFIGSSKDSEEVITPVDVETAPNNQDDITPTSNVDDESVSFFQRLKQSVGLGE